jgi:hypothetical protein
MDRREQPATEIQVRRLQQLGYRFEHPLNREEAMRLIREREAQHGSSKAFDLKKNIESLKLSLAAALSSEEEPLRTKLELLRSQRREYWVNSCREPTKMIDTCSQALELYMKFGCRFTVPNSEQAQEVLDALDAAMPDWEADHPELFYNTLELNFPMLLRHA